MIWYLKHPAATPDHLGILPSFLHEGDPRPAREQIDKNYKHGGWRPFPGVTVDEGCLRYPGDPPFPLIAETKLRDETIRLYFPGAWVAIIQADGSYEVAKID
jgi:hypothetical protein